MKGIATRQCVYTRKRAPARHLLRFIVDDAGNLVPDVRHEKGGRGVYVAPNAILELLSSRQAMRLIRRSISNLSADGIAHLIDSIRCGLHAQLLALLASSHRTGGAIVGGRDCDRRERCVEADDAVWVVARDLSPRQQRRAKSRMCAMDATHVVDALDGQSMARAVGRRDRVNVVVVTHPRIKDAMMAQAARLRSLTPINAVL